MSGQLSVRPHAQTELSVWARWTGTEKYVVAWGDGNISNPMLAGQGAIAHTYAAAGAYMVTAYSWTRENGQGTALGRAQVFLRPGMEPNVTWSADASNPNFIIFSFQELPEDLASQYRLDYGDGSDQETLWGPHGITKTHGYRAGTYVATVQDVQSKRAVKLNVDVKDPVYDPEFSLTKGNDTMSAVVEVTRLVTPGKELLIDWGDYTQETIPASEAAVGVKKTHTYAAATSTIVQLVYADGSTDGSAHGIEIPWPATRGPKPTSRIEWTADPLNANSVFLKWFGAGWHYTIHWGDGSSEKVAFWQPPVKHKYAKAGAYDVVCVSEIRDDWTMSAKVVVRGWLKPDATFAVVPGTNRIKATLGKVPEPVLYRIDWGDGTATEHAGADLTPEHAYPWGTTAPKITVTDLPAKRGAVFTGPDIGPAPDAPVAGFFFEYLSRTTDARKFRLRGGGLKPGETVTYYPHHQSWFREATADDQGRISAEVDIPVGVDAAFDYRWFSYGVVGKNTPRQYVPVHPPRFQAGNADITYQINIDGDPNTLEFSASPAMLGEHKIDFGDGVSTTVDVKKLPLKVKHSYTKTSDITAKITFPDGRSATRSVRGYTPAEPCFNFHYPGSCSVCWLFNGWPEHNCPPGGARGSEEYSPVIIDNGYHAPHQIHRPENGSAWHVAFGYNMPVGNYVFTYTSTFLSTSDHPVNITKARFKHLSPPPIELVILPGEEPQITAWFGDVKEWDGGYSGKFFVTNHSDHDTGWAIEFALAEPAVLREVWPNIAQFKQLADKRWRIWTDTPLPHAGTAQVGVRIEPPGKTRKFPDDITGKTHHSPPPDGDESENE